MDKVIISKKDFEVKISEKINISKIDASKFLMGFIELVKDILANGQDIQLTGFGKFSTCETKARMMKIFGGKEVNVPAGKKVLFKPGKELKDKIK